MCGIYGAIGQFYKKIEPRFSEQLFPRGPDGKGVYYDDTNQVVLGHTRLSIIDVSERSSQPMSDSSGNYALVFNGEIYNYREIRADLIERGFSFYTQSDTEVVLNSFIKWGAECVHLFRGMFSFCIYDRAKSECFFARDRFGIKPLIYSFVNGGFVFSSEIKPILKSNIFPKKLSGSAVSDLFRYGSVRQPKTILDNVYALLPGHTMTVKLDLSYKISSYYNLPKRSLNVDVPNSYDEAVTLVRNELDIATQYHLISDVKVGAFLSGGIDSTAIVALMQRHMSEPVNTFSVGFKENTKVQDETDVASRSARYLGTNHYNIKVDGGYIEDIFDDFIAGLDQPSVDGINTYIVSRETAKQLKVALSGLGGDEIFAGYPHFSDIIENADKRRGWVAKYGSYIQMRRPNRYTKHFLFQGRAVEEALKKKRTLNNDVERVLRYPSEDELPFINDELSPIQRISYKEMSDYMLNTLLRDNDSLSMSNSIEVRPVLLDHKLTELVFRLQDRHKIKNGILKSVFIDSIKDLVPEEVYQRKKTGFEMPLSNWINENLNCEFSSLANSYHATSIFNSRYLSSLRSRINRRSLKKNDWITFVFLSWIKKYEVEI